MSRAVCVRCGAIRDEFEGICPGCGHRPTGDGLLVAWLLSTAHLEDDKLDLVAARIRDGETIRPSDKQLATARKALGRAFATDPGLDWPQRIGLLAASLLLTPLPAWFCFAWWLNDRPRAAWQSFALALPGSLIYFALGVFWVSWPSLETLIERATQ